MPKQIAIIVQRYGMEINGGAEVHARMLAEHLAEKYDVTVLTSRAVEYTTWQPDYPAGPVTVNGISVIRFNNEPRGPEKLQNYMGTKVQGRLPAQIIHRCMGKPDWWARLFPEAVIQESDHIKWLEVQGPSMPDLLTYLREHIDHYSAYIFMTALYYPAAMGVLTVPGKSILVPTMHDEVASYFPIYQRVMNSARWVMFNTAAEQRFSERLFQIGRINKRITGVGIDIIKDRLTPDPAVTQRFGITSPYVIYVGRVVESKGCDVLIRYFTRFVKRFQQPVQLVMVGSNHMEKTAACHSQIIMTGFVADEVKDQLMIQATALLIPSLYESLSLVLLESFCCAVPVIVNGKSEVLKDHIDSSNGGWAFKNYKEFRCAMLEVLKNPGLKEAKGRSGYNYVTRNYSWEKVIKDFDDAIEDVSSSQISGFQPEQRVLRD